jgi:outer membrane protein assembly factor BamB
MKSVVLGLTILIVPAITLAQPEAIRVYTTPAAPSRDALYRLNLTQAWKTRVPTQGRRDGLFSVQIIPGKDALQDNPQLVVQTLSGAVILLDAETGDTLWRTSVGVPYWTPQPVAYNSTSIFASRRNKMHVLHRVTGRERVYTLEKGSNLPVYGFRLESSPSAAPDADEEMIIYPFERRLVAYRIPLFEVDERVRESELKGETTLKRESLQPEFAWGFRTAGQILQPPLLAQGQFSVISTDGTLLSVNQFDGQPRYDFKFQGGAIASAAQYGSIAYAGSDDYTLYAIDMRNGRLLWRLLSGGPIVQPVRTTDADVYLTAQRRGFFRVDRQSGEEHWLNPTAERFLAATQKYVYALDPKGRLLVLDYARGSQLASYDLSDWILSASNDITDRIYLANHDGQVLCLHHRDQVKPLRMRRLEEKRKEKEKEPKDAEKVGGRHDQRRNVPRLSRCNAQQWIDVIRNERKISKL